MGYEAFIVFVSLSSIHASRASRGSRRGFTLLQKACVYGTVPAVLFIGCGCGQECLRAGQAIQRRLKRNPYQPTMAHVQRLSSVA